MTSQEQTRTLPPNAEEILQQFRSPVLLCCRFVFLAILRIIKWIRGVTWKVYGVEHIHEDEGPFIFASNHQSHVDTHAILYAIPKSLRKNTAVAAAFDHFADADGTSRKKRFIQFAVAAVWHAFGIERINSPLRSIRTMNDLLHHGWSLVIYPEGTRSRTGDIASFKPGLAVIAKKSKCHVIPVYISGGLHVLPEATYIPHRGTIKISFGVPLKLQQCESSAEFMTRVESSVRQMAGDT